MLQIYEPVQIAMMVIVYGTWASAGNVPPPPPQYAMVPMAECRRMQRTLRPTVDYTVRVKCHAVK